jgi:hypothetical protein
LPPLTILLNSGHGAHGYYRLSHHVTDLLAWRELQGDLAVLVGGDVKVKNAERVMRLPGFLNVKSQPYVPCEIVECDPGQRIDFAELRSMVPVRPQPKAFTPRSGATANVANADRVKRCMDYLVKCPDAISEQHGHDKTFFAAAECWRFGLSDADAWTVMGWFNTTKCFPQWTEREIAHKLGDARREVGSDFGSRLQSRFTPKSSRSPRHSVAYRRTGTFNVGGL